MFEWLEAVVVGKDRGIMISLINDEVLILEI
jgi:hypothetical protein